MDLLHALGNNTINAVYYYANLLHCAYACTSNLHKIYIIKPSF